MCVVVRLVKGSSATYVCVCAYVREFEVFCGAAHVSLSVWASAGACACVRTTASCPLRRHRKTATGATGGRRRGATSPSGKPATRFATPPPGPPPPLHGQPAPSEAPTQVRGHSQGRRPSEPPPQRRRGAEDGPIACATPKQVATGCRGATGGPPDLPGLRAGRLGKGPE